MSSKAVRYAQDNEKYFLKELFELLSIPSISALPEYKDDVEKAASWLDSHLQEIGLENVKIIRDGWHPVVYADWLHAPGAPTVLIYGHYDVQPPDPLDGWLSPPFAPEVRNNNIYGRGTSDDKAQFFVHLKAIDSFMEVQGKLPVNVKIILEGEEEIGDVHLEEFVQKYKKLLATDFALISDTESDSESQPVIFYGLRGLLYTQLRVATAEQDVHSGLFGGIAENPIQVLSEVIARLKNTNGKVLIPGFYAHVDKLSAQERLEIRQLGKDKDRLTKEAGVKATRIEPSVSAAEAEVVRPTLEINGIHGGFTGEGPKTIIPATATAKISMRLIPHQDPTDIEAKLRTYLSQIMPKKVEWNLSVLSASAPVVVDRNSRELKIASQVLKHVFGKPPTFKRNGGSIPVVEMFSRIMNLPTVLMGFGLPDDNLHAPNEKISLEMFRKGIETSIKFLQEIGK